MKTLSRVTICGAFLIALSGSVFGQNVKTDFDHQADFSQYKTYSWQTIKADPLWDFRIKSAVNAQLAAKGWTHADNSGANTQPPANSTTDTQSTGKGSTQADNGPKFPFPPPPPAAKGGTQAGNGPPQFPFPPPPASAAAQPEPTSSCPACAPCVVIVAIQITQAQKSLQGFYSGFGGGFGFRGFGDSGSINISEQDYQEGTLIIDIYDAKTKQLLWRGSAEGTLSDKAAKNENKLDKAVAKMFKEFPPGSTKR
jgi:hypothetical protein